LDLLNVKYLISLRALDEPDYSLVLDGPTKIYANADVLPRAFFAEKLLTVANEDEVLRRMEYPSFDPEKTVYISEKESTKLLGEFIWEPDADGEVVFEGQVEFLDYQPNRIDLKTHLNQAAFLVLSDSYYPGWKVLVNGKEKPLLRVDYILRGVLLENGESRVTFVFAPVTFHIGAAISLMALAIVLSGLFFLRRKKHTLPCA
jgi:hypothetical protein